VVVLHPSDRVRDGVRIGARAGGVIAPRLCVARAREIPSSPIEQTRDDGRHEPSGRRDNPVVEVQGLYVQQLCEQRNQDDERQGRTDRYDNDPLPRAEELAGALAFSYRFQSGVGVELLERQQRRGVTDELEPDNMDRLVEQRIAGKRD
jgi:hypothetical protein